MSGHLRWLAAQALGQSSGVRPVRRPRLLYDMPQSSGVASSAPDMPMEETRPIGRAEARPAHPMRSAEPADAPPAFTQALAGSRGDADIAATVPVRESEREGTKTRAPRDDDEHLETPVQTEQGEAADDNGDRRHDARVVVHDVITDAPRRPPARPVPRATRLGRLGPERAAPEPAADAPPPPPDVHIHIGRVELTAVAPPAPVRRESASAKKPMSLDEYLRRRSGRER